MATVTHTPRYQAALKHAARHRDELVKSSHCACFFCFCTFSSSQIYQWVDDKQTALCPRCGINAVIGTASGLTVNRRFLRKLNELMFGTRDFS